MEAPYANIEHPTIDYVHHGKEAYLTLDHILYSTRFQSHALLSILFLLLMQDKFPV